ncbi:hypothetical protein K2173_017766 [Erythroxylum novogranatense]|uniref:Pentatricopeptide repeat-containing protein n=1 Tax=Erythroxylum novogranatense TaxID=1862640 RepID=A0AAV8SMK3_9ROSI|nr:hypothetical protein K2173_017766 [Erythroxylum novogranatense]
MTKTDKLLLQLYKQYRHELTSPVILPSVIKATSSSSSSNKSRFGFALQLHCLALKSGSNSYPIVSNALISMYAKFSCIPSVTKLFDTMLLRDVVSWNSILNSHILHAHFSKAFALLQRMSYSHYFPPNPQLTASFISVCARLRYFSFAKSLHALLIVADHNPECQQEHHNPSASVFLSTSLVHFYFTCHDSSMAFRVFDRMEIKNEVSWTAMVSGCAANLDDHAAFHCVRAMQTHGFEPNRVTLLSMLPASARGYVRYGKEIHGYAFRRGLHSDHHFSASLIDMYCKSRSGIALARHIFDASEVKDVVMWSSIIWTYARNGAGFEAIRLFMQMPEEGITPNFVTLLALITACTSLTSLKHGSRVHAYIIKRGFYSHTCIGNALIDMYSKCGFLVDSDRIFREMSSKDSVSWSSLIGGYGLHGYGWKALSLFHEMQDKELQPDAITLLSVLSACRHAGLVEEGQKIFEIAKKDSKLLKIEHYACYIDLLGKSGKTEAALDVLRTLPMKPSPRIWSSLMTACKIDGRLEIAEMLANQLITSEPLNAANYTLVSTVYAESGNWGGVEEVRRLMRTQGMSKCCGVSRIAVGT